MSGSTKSGQNLGRMAVVAVSTVGSRVLGLLREMVAYAWLGASLYNSAFLLAFTLPNLFRRLFGEGALSTALVPTFSQELERSGKEAAFRLLNRVLTRAGLVMAVLVLLGSLSFLTVGGGPEAGRWVYAATLSGLLLPYMWFVCLAALISAALNVLGRFAAAALAPVLLNLSMIVALALLGAWLSEGMGAWVLWLCGGVLVGGLLQLLLPAWALFREGWRPSLDLRSSPALSRLWQIFLPAVFGAAIYQINLVVTRLLAYQLDEASVSLLNLANRLVELPMGVFTISVATVVFPDLSRLVERGDEAGIQRSYGQGLRLALAIACASAAGLAALAGPVLGLFQWGAFRAEDVAATEPVLLAAALGIPFYTLATLATRGFYAMGDTKTPVRFGALALVLNVGFALLLMKPLGTTGLALAGTLAVAVQSLLLQRLLTLRREGFRGLGLSAAVLRMFVACALMGGLVYGLAAVWPVEAFAFLGSKGGLLLEVGVLVGLGALTYLLALRLLGFAEVGEMLALVRRRRAR